MRRHGVIGILLLIGIFGPLLGHETEDRSKDILNPIDSMDQACDGSTTQPPQRGLASWYGVPFHGRTMANGKPFDMHGRTVAHRTLPLGTIVCVTGKENGKSVRATVTDRGPYVSPRIIDLSYRLAQDLDLVERGVGPVEIRVIEQRT